MPSFPIQRAVIGSQRGLGSAYLSTSPLFLWGNTPVPFEWNPAYKLVGFNNGDLVLTWTDFSGNSHDLTASPGREATYTTAGGPNSNPFIQFNGASMFYNFVDMSAFTEATMFIIFKNITATDGPFLFKLAESSTDPNSFIPYVGDGTVYDSFFSTTRKEGISGGGGFTTGWHIYEVSSRASLWTNWLDGAQLFTTATNTVSAPSAGQLGFGAGFYSGAIADVVVFNSYLSNADRTSVRAALKTKYGTP